jgi:alpha/beta superfamily hydrolase
MAPQRWSHSRRCRSKRARSYFLRRPLNGWSRVADGIIPEESTAKLADKLDKQKNISIDYKVIKGCDHFFRNHLEDMEKHVEKYLDTNL